MQNLSGIFGTGKFSVIGHTDKFSMANMEFPLLVKRAHKLLASFIYSIYMHASYTGVYIDDTVHCLRTAPSMYTYIPLLCIERQKN